MSVKFFRHTRSKELQRLDVLLGFGVLIWLVVLVTVFQIQILESGKYTQLVERKSTPRKILQAQRGLVLDRNGEVLAANSLVEIEVNGKKRNIKRLNPHGALAGQVLGRLNHLGKGQSGLESKLDDDLRGVDGWTFIRRNVKRKVYDGFLSDAYQDAVPGLNIVLSIDRKAQEIAERALERGVQKVKADRGSAIVVDPYTGDILAMASYPFFNPNAASVNQEALRNDVISKGYEPGSTFKLVAAAAALEEQKIDIDDIVDTENGIYRFKDRSTIKDHGQKYGKISFTEVMAKSSNVGLAKVSDLLGNELFFRYMRMFGFGNRTGVELPSELNCGLKTIDRWSGRSRQSMAIGHELQTTQMQIAMAYAAIANGGELLKPRLIKEYQDPRNNQTIRQVEVETIRRVVSSDVASKVRYMLKKVVEEGGTASNLKNSKISLAGKTGTAEKYDVVLKKYLHGSQNSSFVALAPADNPQFVVMVVVDEPRTYTSGARTAGPIVKEIVERMFLTPELVKSYALKPPTKSKLPNFIGLTKEEVKDLESIYKIAWSGKGNIIDTQKPIASSWVAQGDSLFLNVKGYKNNSRDSLLQSQELLSMVSGGSK